MTLETLIEYRDKINSIVLKYQSKNKKWVWLSSLPLIIGILLIIVPAMIVGDNNGQVKPVYFFILVFLGLLVVLGGLFCLGIYIYHRILITKYKNYKDSLSHEITSLVRNKKNESTKDFSFLDKINI